MNAPVTPARPRTPYAAAIGRLFAMESRGIRMGVQRMADALDYRGRPDRGLRLIHVAGTNGKGSVASMLAACLTAAGYRTGLFTSPHLHRWVERIRIDGRPLSERDAARRIDEVLGAFAEPDAPESTFFELTTLMAIEAFRDKGCDIAVMEVGLGGRLDATNATTPELCIITRIALDHLRILGGTVSAIAREKAGILKPEVPLVLGDAPPEARRVIMNHARRLAVPVRRLDRDFHVRAGPTAGRLAGTFDVELPGANVGPLKLGLPGVHQSRNAACAVAGIQWLAERGVVDAVSAVPQGMRRVRWPGRLETIASRPRIIADAAHNEDGCQALARHVGALRGLAGARVLIFGCMRDKAIKPMLRALRDEFDHILYCPPAMKRAAPVSLMQRAAKGERATDLDAALDRARSLAGDDGLIVVAGSLFLIADARAKVLGVRSDPPIRM